MINPAVARRDSDALGQFRVPATTIDPRVHTDYHILLWQAHGRSTFTVDGLRVELSQHEALWIPPGCWHAFTVHEDSVLLPIFFDVGAVATMMAEPTLITLDAAAQLLCLVELQAQNSIIRPPTDTQRHLLGHIEHTTRPTPSVPLPRTPVALAVAEALLFDPGDPRTVQEWAASVHVSARSLERAFLRETGMSFGQWRQRYRLEAACGLLRRLGTVAAVARRVGYDSHSAFSRVFRTHFGETPTEYAARFAAA